MRRKQAEFLAKNHVPTTCICGLIVTTSEQEQKAKDILTSAADALVNTVNTVGVMGKGIALQFKEEFPGKLLITRERNKAGEEKIIVNFPTKLH